MWRFLLIAAQLSTTILYIWSFNEMSNSHPAAWMVPTLLIVLVIVNSIWSSRLLSWIIFSAAFFSFLVILSAFTLRWRLETGFSPYPFYRAILMYVAFVYVSLAQLKLLGPKKIEPKKS